MWLVIILLLADSLYSAEKTIFLQDIDMSGKQIFNCSSITVNNPYTLAQIHSSQTFTGLNSFNNQVTVSSNIVLSTSAFIGASGTNGIYLDTTNGRVGIGTTNPDLGINIAKSGAIAGAAVECYSTTLGHNSVLYLRRSHNDVLGNLTPTVNQESIGAILFQAVRSNNTRGLGAGIYAEQFGNAGAVYIPTNLRFRVSSGSDPYDNALFIRYDSNIGIGTSSPSEKLMVAGNIAPEANKTRNIGTPALSWNTIYVSSVYLTTPDLPTKKKAKDWFVGISTSPKEGTTNKIKKDTFGDAYIPARPEDSQVFRDKIYTEDTSRPDIQTEHLEDGTKKYFYEQERICEPQDTIDLGQSFMNLLIYIKDLEERVKYLENR